tara:strand:+ start:217 stop:942 length:726 start_codon:yes stop_codon:yes gene_type:complete
LKKYFKKKIKLILSNFGWKLVKLRKIPEPNPYGKLDINLLKEINDSTGIIHLGAHRGTEAEIYNWFGKKVIWVEAIPEIYEHLKDNLYFYKNQKAYLALLSDKDNEMQKFYISNHDGACSSLFEFTDEINSSRQWGKKDHKMISVNSLKSITLDTLLKEKNINAKKYNHWILDLQGAELLALKGAEESLKDCKSLMIEVSKKRFYSGGVLWNEIKEWLSKKGFYQTREPENDEDDILFVKK